MADKTLRVCLSSELPDILERDQNFIYFLYDKLMLFVGQSIYNDPFCIVSEMPENPVTGMLYLVISDGIAKSYIDYTVTDIATIESEDQIEILKQSGTTFFVNADKRYLDLQRRTITLPYLNGNYLLTVDLANDLILDENTVLAFNTETNEFEISGDTIDANKEFKKTYDGSESDTTFTNVDDYIISTDIKISPAYDNILKIMGSGLYASVSDRVPSKAFNTWKANFDQYKADMESYLADLDSKIDSVAGVVSESSLNSKIKSALKSVYSEIDSALSTLTTMSTQFSGIESRVKAYADDKFTVAEDDLNEAIREATEDPWEEF